MARHLSILPGHLTSGWPLFRALKENCNVKTSRFHLKGRSKSCKMRPKSLKSAKAFSRFDNFTTKSDRKTENVVFRGFAQTEEQ